MKMSLIVVSLIAAVPILAVAAPPRTAGIEENGYVWNAQEGEKIDALQASGNVRKGKEAYEVCGACHLPSGAGRADGTFPQLAGQHSTVLIKQIADIRAGLRDNPVMHPFAATLSGSQELADTAAYLQGLCIPPSHGEYVGADASAQVAKGKELYEKECAQCHGVNGEGNKDKFYPVIAGQHYKYLLRQMTEIRDGKRRNANPDMVSIIKKYDDSQLVAISAYQASLVMPGNICNGVMRAQGNRPQPANSQNRTSSSVPSTTAAAPPAPQAGSSSGMSGFFGGLIKGVAAGVADKSANLIGADAAKSGGAAGVFGRAAAAHNREAANQLRMGGGDSEEARIGSTIGNAMGGGGSGGGGLAGSVASALAGSGAGRTGAGASATATSLAMSDTGGSGAYANAQAYLDYLRSTGARHGCPYNRTNVWQNGASECWRAFFPGETSLQRNCRVTEALNYCDAARLEAMRKNGDGGNGAATPSADPATVKACQSNYAGPNDNPQTDSYCKLAQHNLCMSNATGNSSFKEQAATACTILDKVLASLGGGTAGQYCRYCR